MGIVAFCPNGHRVKVKDEFAGRKGVCPECHARFRIPLQSCPLPTARVLGLDPAWAASLPRAVILPADHAFSKSEPGPARHRASAPPALHPLLAAEPDAAWCIAIPGGEPSAPLSAAEMQAWLGGGGATGEELVWRSDWAGWLPIRRVFPEHVPGA